MSIARDPGQFANILLSLGAPAAMAYLNAGVPHRYSAVYRLRDDEFENIFLHDKEGEVIPEFLAVVPFEVSFSQFVLRDSAFRTDDSGADTRLDRHKYQGVVASYHGVPILDNTGELAGTLCHFDVVAHPLSETEFVMLQEAGRAFPLRLLQRSISKTAPTYLGCSDIERQDVANRDLPVTEVRSPPRAGWQVGHDQIRSSYPRPSPC